MSEKWRIYTAGKNFTLPPAVTAVTNLTFAYRFTVLCPMFIVFDAVLTEKLSIRNSILASVWALEC